MKKSYTRMFARVALSVMALVPVLVNAAPAYNPPGTGWTYMWDGTNCLTGTPQGHDSLDGTWSRGETNRFDGNQNDSWDGFGITGNGYVPRDLVNGTPPFYGEEYPGGIEIFNDTEPGTTFLRFQDAIFATIMAGGATQGDTNTKVSLIKDISSMTYSNYTTNLTFYFRARIPTAGHAGKLDPISTGGNYDNAAYPVGGDGMWPRSNTKGINMFTFKESHFPEATTGERRAMTFGFGLSASNWNVARGTNFDRYGSPLTNLIDAFVYPFSSNVVDYTTSDAFRQFSTYPMPGQITNWNDFWVTLTPGTNVDGSESISNRIMTLWLNGSKDPAVVSHIRMGQDTDMFCGRRSMLMGCPMWEYDQSGALDVDFFGFHVGASPPPPTITTPPSSASRNVGESVQFTVVAEAAPTGTTLAGYQWRKDGVALVDDGRISGATAASLTISDCESADAGDYSVAVTNSIGGYAISPEAVLTVIGPPSPPMLSASLNGDSLILSWELAGAGFELWGASNLVPPVAWVPETALLQTNAQEITATVPISSDSRFFRLIWP